MTNPSAGNFESGNAYAKGYASSLIPFYATTTTFGITSGVSLDSTSNTNVAVESSLTVNSAVVGANGIDTGAIAATKIYAAHVIWNSLDRSVLPAGLMSLSDTAPILPTGYDSFYRCGWVLTDGSSVFRTLHAFGHGNTVNYSFDTPVSILSAGNATSQTAISLLNLAPAINKTLVNVASALTPSAASQTLTLYPSGSTGTSQTIVTGQVASVVVTQRDGLNALLISSVPKIDYKVSNSAAAATIYICGFVDRR